jgi:hypothetical protein
VTACIMTRPLRSCLPFPQLYAQGQSSLPTRALRSYPPELKWKFKTWDQYRELRAGPGPDTYTLLRRRKFAFVTGELVMDAHELTVHVGFRI